MVYLILCSGVVHDAPNPVFHLAPRGRLASRPAAAAAPDADAAEAHSAVAESARGGAEHRVTLAVNVLAGFGWQPWLVTVYLHLRVFLTSFSGLGIEL